MKLIDFSKHPRWLEKESSILSKRIVGAKRENRRFFLKESSVLMGSKSIYSPKSLNCYVSGGNNTWQKHSKIIVFPLGFREAFSLLPSCLCGFIWSNTIEMGGFGKILVFSKRCSVLMKTPVILWAIYVMGRGCAFRYTLIATMYGQSHSRQSPLIFYWARIDGERRK